MPTNHRVLALSRAELARRAGKGRSTITEACAGPLKAACLGAGRVDAGHPVLVAYAREVWRIDPSRLRDLHPAHAVAAPSPGSHLSFTVFAKLAGEPTQAVVDAATSGELANATFGNRVDLRATAALEYLAARPLPVGADGCVDCSSLPAGCFADSASPLARACFARMYGTSELHS